MARGLAAGVQQRPVQPAEAHDADRGHRGLRVTQFAYYFKGGRFPGGSWEAGLGLELVLKTIAFKLQY
jgi:hypothetical protein